MIRESIYVIFFKDIDNKLVQVKHYNQYVEYWVYKEKNTKSLVWLPKNRKLYHDREDTYLDCIIACTEQQPRKKGKKGIKIKGIKITGDSLNKYLAKTNRGVD